MLSSATVGFENMFGVYHTKYISSGVHLQHLKTQTRLFQYSRDDYLVLMSLLLALSANFMLFDGTNEKRGYTSSEKDKSTEHKLPEKKLPHTKRKKNRGMIH